MARILVTGASGQLAPCVVSALESAGYEPVMLFRVSGEAAKDRVILPDPWTEEALAEVMDGFGVHAIVNLAGAGVRPGGAGAGALEQANVALPLMLIDAASRVGGAMKIRAIVNMGSGSEYAGGTAEASLDERAALTTTNAYGVSKAQGAVLGLERAAGAGIAFGHLRLFGVFGEHEAAHRLLPSLVRGLLEGRVVPLSPGRQIRDWLYEPDVGSAVVAALRSLDDGAMMSGVYNLGSGTGHSVRDFACRVADQLGAPRALLDFGAVPMRPSEENVLVADVRAFAACTGWSPVHSLDSGLAQALSHMAGPSSRSSRWSVA